MAQDKEDRFNKALGGQAEPASFESSSSSPQGAAKLKRQKAAHQQRMKLALAKIRSSGLLQQIGRKK